MTNHNTSVPIFEELLETEVQNSCDYGDLEDYKEVFGIIDEE